jgi:hypothetical protein
MSHVRAPQSGITVLHQACRYNSEEVVVRLLPYYHLVEGMLDATCAVGLLPRMTGAG